MPLVINGVIIPENAPDKLIVNGLATDTLIDNSINVYNAQYFSAIWSGSSTAINNSSPHTFRTSGASFRADTISGDSGAWLSSYSNGTFQNGVSRYTPTAYQLEIGSGGYAGIPANGIQAGFYFNDDTFQGSPVTFSISTGFTGGVSSGNYTLASSGGLMRLNGDTNGAWISLT